MPALRRWFGAFVAFLFYKEDDKLTTTQIHVWSCLIGLVVGVAVTGYSYALEGLVTLIWKILPDTLEPFCGPRFPVYNMNWILPLVWGGLVAGAVLSVFNRYSLKTGSIISVIRGVHDEGIVPFRNFFPMLFVSLITITAGGSAGPEASVMVMGAALMHLLNRLLAQPLRERRIITLCGMSAALSAFFGMPLTGAIFVLEVPHHNGIEYFEAISPCVVASVVSSMINKLISGRSLGGKFQYIPIVEPLNFVDMAWSVVLGVMAGLTALAFIGLMRFGKWMSHKTTLDKYPFLSSLIGGALVGVSGLVAPSSLFWSENELQWALSAGNSTLPFAITPSLIEYAAPLLGWQMFLTGILKLMAIAFTVCFGWPGGIIFPLYFAGALLGQGWGIVMQIHPTVACTAFMAALEASVLRTPWASVLIVLVSQGGFGAGEGTYFLQTFPLMIIAVMVSMIIVYWTRLYGSEQHGRRDLVFNTSLESGFTMLNDPVEQSEGRTPGYSSGEAAPLVINATQ